MLTRQEKRAYQCLLTGLSIGSQNNAFYRFLTLTTKRGVCRNMNKDFDLLKKRIQRAVYKRDGFRGFKFNRYFKMKTAEGYGVMHIVYWGRYIPQEWLSKTWQEIHKSPIVDIRAGYSNDKTNVRGLVGYLLTNYLTKQPLIRFSYGWKWAWVGMRKTWNSLRKMEIRKGCVNLSDVDRIPATWRWRKVGLEYWRYLINKPPSNSRQTHFCSEDFSRTNMRFCSQKAKPDSKLKFWVAILAYLSREVKPQQKVIEYFRKPRDLYPHRIA